MATKKSKAGLRERLTALYHQYMMPDTYSRRMTRYSAYDSDAILIRVSVYCTLYSVQVHCIVYTIHYTVYGDCLLVYTVCWELMGIPLLISV